MVPIFHPDSSIKDMFGMLVFPSFLFQARPMQNVSFIRIPWSEKSAVLQTTTT